eukprot:m.31253 g.31253  ORF g.31253 m.31253 type:complete len:131 (+) comp10678_c1_seq1:1390-1782(+)
MAVFALNRCLFLFDWLQLFGLKVDIEFFCCCFFHKKKCKKHLDLFFLELTNLHYMSIRQQVSQALADCSTKIKTIVCAALRLVKEDMQHSKLPVGVGLNTTAGKSRRKLYGGGKQNHQRKFKQSWQMPKT